MRSKETFADVLVIGGGPAGFFSAIKAKETGAEHVTLVCKAVAGSSGGAMYAGGNIRDYRPEDAEGVLPFLVQRKAFLTDQEWLLESIKENHKRMDELRKWGVKFIKKRDKEVRTGMGLPGGGSANPNVWFDGGSWQFLWTLRSQALRVGVNIVDRVMVTDLLTSDGKHPTAGKVVGAVGINVRNGDWYIFKSRATVLAAGAFVIPRHSPPDLSGDGTAMAIRAGATARGLETMDFLHQGGVPANGAMGSCAVWHSFGTRMVNLLHPQWREDVDYFYGGMPRRKFSMEQAREALRIEKKDLPSPESYGGPAWDFGWHASFKEVTAENLLVIYKNNPRVFRIYEKSGVTIPEDIFKVVSVPFSSPNGEIGVNRRYESSLAGLFVAGDNAGALGHGMGINGAMVDGAIAGTSAAEYAKKEAEPAVVPEQVETLKETAYASTSVKSGIRPLNLRHRLIEAVCSIFPPTKGVMTNEERLNKAIDEIERLRREELPRLSAKDPHQVMKANEMRSLLTLFPLAFKGAIIRKESRFLAREDYPFRDDKNWLKFLKLRLRDDGEAEFWTEDVPPMKIKPAEVK